MGAHRQERRHQGGLTTMTTIASLAHIVGTGPVRVLALHGWFGSAQAWGPFAELLDPARFSVAYFDYRGYGARIHETGEYSLDEIATDALQLADELGWQRFHLMGHSMGGKAIVRTLVAAPERVGSMLAITPVPVCAIPFDEPTWQLFSSAATDIASRRAIIDFSTGSRLSKRWIAALADHSWAHSTPEAFGAYLQAWAKTDFVAQAKGMEAPIHVVVGENDASITAELMQATTMQWFPHASLEVMRGAGHYPTDETPVALATSAEKAFASGSA
jgi:pimeloyl-ACP methyl ester carboxylesterase